MASANICYDYYFDLNYNYVCERLAYKCHQMRMYSYTSETLLPANRRAKSYARICYDEIYNVYCIVIVSEWKIKIT